MRGVLLLAALVSVPGCILSARILAVLPFPGKSHYIFMSAVLRPLLERGHHIVEFSPFPPSKPISNFTHTEIHTRFEKATRDWTYEGFKQTCINDTPKLLRFSAVWQIAYEVCEDTFQHKSIKKLLKSNEQFDLVITESTFGQESLVVFGHRFQAPTITLQSFPTMSAMNRDAGNTLSLASVPDLTSFVATDQMSFVERMLNIIAVTTTLMSYYLHHLPAHENIIKDHYGEDTPSLVDMVSNISLYLINSHPATGGYPQPYSPNIIPIAGISISPDRTPLPQNIQKLMDEAEEGVIYFSLGTVVPVHLMPQDILQIFVNVFKKVTQKVIWKIDLETIPGISKNVMLVKWVPQPGVLAHPKCVLFMTHGGLLSQQEAIHAGVPTVSIPFFGDQQYNVRYSEHSGVGVKLDFMTLSEESVMRALNTVLKNPKYKENAAQLSHIYRDRPMSPADTVVFWVEYVLRHRGAPHLRPAAARLSWYQLTLLDILAAILTVTLAILATLYFILRKILYLMCGKKEIQYTVKIKKKN